MEYENEQRGYDGMSRGPQATHVNTDWRTDEPRGYERDRSRSPRGDRRDDGARARSASPGGRDSRYVTACSAR
mgnify:CR=1 FL=1